MVTITVIFWGRWGCWILPLFSYKRNGRHWKPQMMFTRLKNVLSSHTVFRSLFKTKCGNQRTVATKQNQQKSSYAATETFASYSHLLPSLDQCLEKISDLKSFSSRHFPIPHLQSMFSWGKHSSTEGRPWHPGGELLHTGDFHAKWNTQSQNKKWRNTETMTMILKCQTSSLCGIFHQHL